MIWKLRIELSKQWYGRQASVLKNIKNLTKGGGRVYNKCTLYSEYTVFVYSTVYIQYTNYP